MVELHERAVADVVRRNVVVLDVLRQVAATQRAGSLIARGWQPLAEGLHLLARVHCRQRRGNPARFQRVGGIGARTDLMQAVVLAHFEDGVLHFIAFAVGAPNLEARCAGHAVAQCAYLPAGDVDVAHVEELDVRHRAAIQFFDDGLRVRALNLVAVVLAYHRLAHGARGRTVVFDDLDVEAAGLGVEHDPVGRRRAADEHVLVRREVEQDAVADDVAVVADRHELLGLLGREAFEAVDGEIGQELGGIRAFDEQVHHVVRLVEQHGGLAPSFLFGTPVAEFRGDDRVHVGTDLRVA